MAELLCTAILLITRSGYSTLMDLNALGMSNVELHATPGQAEQLCLKKIGYLRNHNSTHGQTHRTTTRNDA
jgi:hypothetical protein